MAHRNTQKFKSTHTHTHTYMHTHAHAHTHTHTCMHTHMHACTHACICTHAYTNTHTHAPLKTVNQSVRQTDRFMYSPDVFLHQFCIMLTELGQQFRRFGANLIHIPASLVNIIHKFLQNKISRTRSFRKESCHLFLLSVCDRI